MIIKLDHIAIAVKDLESALEPYTKALGLTVSDTEEIPDQQVRIACLPIGDTEIELLEPTTDDSGVAKFLEKRGEGLHHICLEVDDLKATLARLKDQGMRLIDEEPRDGGKGKRIAFVHPRSMTGVLIELTEG